MEQTTSTATVLPRETTAGDRAMQGGVGGGGSIEKLGDVAAK